MLPKSSHINSRKNKRVMVIIACIAAWACVIILGRDQNYIQVYHGVKDFTITLLDFLSTPFPSSTKS